MTTDKLENELYELVSGGGYRYLHNVPELETLLEKLEEEKYR